MSRVDLISIKTKQRFKYEIQNDKEEVVSLLHKTRKIKKKQKQQKKKNISIRSQTQSERIKIRKSKKEERYKKIRLQQAIDKHISSISKYNTWIALLEQDSIINEINSYNNMEQKIL